MVRALVLEQVYGHLHEHVHRHALLSSTWPLKCSALAVRQGCANTAFLWQGYDVLNIFDGDEPLASLSGAPPVPLTFTARSGSMRLVFSTDGSV